MDTIKNIILEIEKLKQEQNYTEAKTITENSITKYNFDYRLYEELADIYLFTGELVKALKAIDFALSLHPESATGNYLKGFILLSKDKVDEALIFLEKSNSILGNNPEVLRNMGWSYVMKGETDKGIAILKRALILSPEDELITEDLAMALIGIGEISEGNGLLKKIGKKNML